MKEILIIEDDKKYPGSLNCSLSMRALRRLKLFRVGRELKPIINTLLLIWFYSILCCQRSPAVVFWNISKQNHHLPIILLTAKDDTSDVVTGFELGADDYVTKPFNFDELLARIKANIEKTPQKLRWTRIWYLKTLRLIWTLSVLNARVRNHLIPNWIWSSLLSGSQPWSGSVPGTDPGQSLGLLIMTVAIILLMFISNICVTKSIGILMKNWSRPCGAGAMWFDKLNLPGRKPLKIYHRIVFAPFWLSPLFWLCRFWVVFFFSQRLILNTKANRRWLL